ncbi:hypothetical protein WICPIJ_008447 [Wickerhamomyces pijperi]|uniref:Adenylyl cyclase-associated protein n=1 Tax=Wickerhamomyces pijperi TaxID=599730 RepID=A0A9P8TIG4_WICPI|nr:hypothetical protein WICPIJ_008447 [Wickerhamomyces pijperi]
MAHPQRDSFDALFERLEKATTALEQIVTSNSSEAKAATGAEGTAPEVSATNASAVAATAAAVAAPTGAVNVDKSLSVTSASQPEGQTPAVQAFDEFLELYIQPFVSVSKEISPLLGEQAQHFATAFSTQRQFIVAAGISSKPDMTSASFASLLAPLQESILKVSDLKDANRRSELFDNLNSISEGTGVLSWFLTPTPQSYVTDIKDSATFWTNKVLKQFKEKDERQVDWVKLFLNIFDGLKLYAKQWHTTGLTFAVADKIQGSFEENLKKINEEPKSTSAGSSISAPAAGGPPPPPPPPPPANLFDDITPASTASAAPSGGLNAVFSELNQGENITKGLKKVDKSQMTHKNPSLRASSAVPGKKSPPPKPVKPAHLSKSPATSPAPSIITKPEPIVELRDSKWFIKNVEDKHDVVIDVELSQSIFIADCKNATIQVKGKANAISISNTFKLALVVESLVSGVDIVNSKKFGIQVLQSIPMLSCDRCDEGQVYLSEESLTTEVYTSSTTALNVNLPQTDGDFKECGVPEQLKHTFVGGVLKSEIVEHAG